MIDKWSVWRERIRRGLLVFGCCVAGCFAHSGAKERHEAFYDCSEVTSHDVEAEGHTQVKTVGCGHEEIFYCIGIKCRSARLLSLRLFAGDHGCHTDKSSAQAEGDDVWAVSGCGKQQKYRCVQVPNEVLRCDALP